MDLLKQYNAFVKFRAKFIDTACKNAVYTDTRTNADGSATPFRPVVVLNDPASLRTIHSQIAKWKVEADRLTENDPVRFSAVATQFSLLPTVIQNPRAIAISEGVAQSSRTMSKATILFRLRTMLKKELLHHDGNITELARAIQDEIDEREADPETTYRVIGSPHTELYLYFDPAEGGKTKRIRVTQSGVFIYSPASVTMPIKFPHEKPTRNVTNGADLARLGMKPLKTNLQLSANLYRESERTTAMQKRENERAKARILRPKTNLSAISA